MTYETLKVTAGDGVLTVALNRPTHRNALDHVMLQELQSACQTIASNEAVRAVVVRGTGPAFCAGVDLGDLSSLLRVSTTDDPNGGRAASEMAELGAQMVRAVESLPQPTVAAIHGYAIGAGVVLAAACDIRIMTTDAFIAIPELDLGTPLLWGGLPRLVREIGMSAAKDLVMTCRRVVSPEAQTLGFAARVVAPDELDQAILEMGQGLASRPPFAMQVTKRHFRSLASALVVGDTGYADSFVHGFGWERPDVRARIESFVAERVPSVETNRTE